MEMVFEGREEKYPVAPSLFRRSCSCPASNLPANVQALLAAGPTLPLVSPSYPLLGYGLGSQGPPSCIGWSANFLMSAGPRLRSPIMKI